MSQETHYICEVCKKVAVIKGRDSGEESDDISKWFYVNLTASMLGSMRDEKRSYLVGHVCSIECMDDCFDSMRRVALAKAKENNK